MEAAILTWAKAPIDVRSAGLVAAPVTGKLLDSYEEGAAYRNERNEVLDISGGITFRPYIVEDTDGDPNRVFVYDCQIDATVWRNRDTGAPAPPDQNWPNVGVPGVAFGGLAIMIQQDGRWLVDEGYADPSACL
jgi:hypothetical protein